jgi:pimeloyl-ACP methyl ester carboxylesterase
LYVRFPRLAAPVFFAGVPGRLREEIASALPDRRERWRLAWETARTFVRAPISPSRMARRALLIGRTDAASDAARIEAPTLVVTGEPRLDRVVPVEGTLEYARSIRNARSVEIAHTGHLGCITRPREFAADLRAFVQGAGVAASHHAA